MCILALSLPRPSISLKLSIIMLPSYFSHPIYHQLALYIQRPQCFYSGITTTTTTTTTTAAAAAAFREDTMSTPSSPSPTTINSWSISEDSLRRYVSYASESCIQELLSASDSSREIGDDGWKFLTFENGVEISKRRSGALHVFRSRWLLQSVSPQQFITVANAIDAAKQWDSDLVEAKYLRDLGENLSIIHLKFGEASKPLFKNREFVVYERRETMDDGTLVVAVASLPKEIAAGLLPKKNNSIRGLLLQSGWVVEKLHDDSCIVTYVVQLDPAGWLPRFFVNRHNTKLVMIIENLRKLAQDCPTSGEICEDN